MVARYLVGPCVRGHADPQTPVRHGRLRSRNRALLYAPTTSKESVPSGSDKFPQYSRSRSASLNAGPSATSGLSP